MESIRRYLWIDHLRALAVSGVVCIHVAGIVLYQYNSAGLADWWIGNIFDSASRFALPIFGMLIGATLLQSKESMQLFYQKRMLRLLPPLLFWGAIYLVFYFALSIYHKEHYTLNSFFEWLYSKLEIGVSVHFWYVYMVILMYLIMPFFRAWIQKQSNRNLLIFLAIWYLLLVLQIPYISDNYWIKKTLYFIHFLGYPVLGFYLMNHTVKSTPVLLVLWLGMLFYTAFRTYSSTTVDGEFFDQYYSYLSPNIVLMSLSIFLLVQRFTINNTYVLSALHFLSKYSYGISMVHLIILWLLSFAGITWQLIHPAFGIIVTTLLCLLFSGMVVSLIHRQRWGKYISG